jgi:hypothetical protein
VPGPAVTTTTRWANATASSRSWVMKMTEDLVRYHRLSSSLDMVAWVCTSRVPNGSSISRIEGSLKGCGQSHAFTDTARQLVWVVILESGQAHNTDPLTRLAVRFGLTQTAKPRSHRDIAEKCLPRNVRCRCHRPQWRTSW